MIIEVKELPKGKIRPNGGQKGQIYRDIKQAMSEGIKLFELVDDSYNYKYLSGYARDVLDDIFRREYGRELWEPYRKELVEFFKNDGRNSNFYVGAYELSAAFAGFYSVKTIKDEELGRNRVFVELKYSEEQADRAMKALAEKQKREHIAFLKKYYPREGSLYDV